MKLSVYKSYDDLPLFLNAQDGWRRYWACPSPPPTSYSTAPASPRCVWEGRMVVPKRNSSSGRRDSREVPNEKTALAQAGPLKNYFPLPNEIFSLGLSAGAIAVYGFLLHREDRRLSVRGRLPDHRRGGGDERQHGAQVCDRTGGSGSNPDGAHHRHHPGRPHPQRLSAYYILPIQMSIDSSMSDSSTQLTWRWNDRERNNAWRR